jgi:DNA-binding PadR family transcriptional regulator
MSIRSAILGFLSWKPFTGYELKKLFADSLSFHWSGNNNQIYGTLIKLHAEGRVAIEVQQQEKRPARKIYTITEDGREELRTWLLSEPELPEVRNLFQLRLAWAENLGSAELERAIEEYARLLEGQVLMCRERARRGGEAPARSPREILIWSRIEENRIEGFERELAWLRTLAKELSALEPGKHRGSR